MSKLDVGVGDEFPLDEGGFDDRHAWKQAYRARRRAMHAHRHGHHHHGHHHHGHHHGHGRRHHGFGRLPALLVIGGLIALIVNHQLTASIAYGMIGIGAALLALMVLARAIWHWRLHRRLSSQTAQVA